jgi:heptosyltransferase-1
VPDPDAFYNKTRDARKIIVVDLGFLGDSVHTVPALWEIKRNYPQAELHVLSAPVGAELLKLAPCVDRAWSFPLGPPSPPWWKHWDIIRQLRRERFDLLFNFSGADRTIWISGILGAKWKIAYPGGRDHFWNSWLIPEWLAKISETVPIFEKRRRMLGLCGLKLDAPRFDLAIPADERQWATSAIPKGSIHLSINASSPFKEWPIGRWVELICRLSEWQPGIRIIATASSSEREFNRLSELKRQITAKQLQTFSGLNIGQLAALLGRCAIHVGGDSGVVHLAFALGIRTVSFFRHYGRVHEWIPNGPCHRHVVASCHCEHGLTSECSAAVRALCLEKIDADQIFQLVQELNSTSSHEIGSSL